MKGSNTLKLNHQTMCEAMQVWLDKTLADSSRTKVSEVKGSPTNYGGSDFEVTVVTEEDGTA